MIISLFYPSLGGSQQQALILSEHLIKKGIPVSVLTRSLKGRPSFEMIRGVPVYRCIRTLTWGKWFGVTYLLSVLWFLYRQRHTYDIIHCHILQGLHSAASLLLKFFFKKKVIIKVAATGPLSDFSTLSKMFLGVFLLKKIRSADRIVTVCAQSKQEALKQGFRPSSIIQISNGVDTRCFKPSPSGRVSAGKVIFVGRLDAMKAVHVLIEAFKKLKDEGSAASLDIIGDGPDMDRLKRLKDSLGLNRSVNFCGEKQGVAKHLQESTVFVLPSLSEGLSNVILEAMACALPVVVTRVGGTADLIQDGINGILVEPNSPDLLKEALKRILEDKNLAEKMGAEARKTVEEKFSMEYVSERYMSIYQELQASGK